jgi:hypothetical protein
MPKLYLSIEAESTQDLLNAIAAFQPNSVIVNNGTALQRLVDGLVPESAAAEPVAAKPNYTTFGVNVYDSESEAFALGKKIYASAIEAEQRRTRNGNWATSFNLDIDLETGRVRASGDHSDNEVRYFAVNNLGGDISFSHGYDSHLGAAAQNPGSLTVVGISVDDDNRVAISQ